PWLRSSNSEMCSLDAVARNLMSPMSDHIYKKIELVGSSPNGIEDAVNNAIGRAAKTIRNMKWFEVAEVRGNSPTVFARSLSPGNSVLGRNCPRSEPWLSTSAFITTQWPKRIDSWPTKVGWN